MHSLDLISTQFQILLWGSESPGLVNNWSYRGGQGHPEEHVWKLGHLPSTDLSTPPLSLPITGGRSEGSPAFYWCCVWIEAKDSNIDS